MTLIACVMVIDIFLVRLVCGIMVSYFECERVFWHLLMNTFLVRLKTVSVLS